MKIRLLGWESEGLRCPDVKVELAKSGYKKVALIQMPNGTGKTTTLNLIRAALTGEAQNWDGDQVNQYKRRDSDIPVGKFILRLSVDDKPLTFDLKLDFSEGGVIYRTTSPATGGVVDGWKPPVSVRRFLTERFVNLFVFDGELANKMLDSKQARAEEAIDALCQLELLEEIRNVAEIHWQQATKEKGAKTASGLTWWRTRKDVLEEKYNKLLSIRAKASSDLKELKGEIAKSKKLRETFLNEDESKKNDLASFLLKDAQ